MKFKSTKLYFTGDGGGTDYNVIYEYMFVSLLLFLAVMSVVDLLRHARPKKILRDYVLLFAAGVLVVLIFGTIITRLSLHSACDEYGPNTAVCQDEQSPEQGLIWKLIH